jgi:hypothetical protein
VTSTLPFNDSSCQEAIYLRFKISSGQSVSQRLVANDRKPLLGKSRAEHRRIREPLGQKAPKELVAFGLHKTAYVISQLRRNGTDEYEATFYLGSQPNDGVDAVIQSFG